MRFGLPRTQKTAAPAPANQNTGRETAPARLIWWGTFSSLPGKEANYKSENTKIIPFAGLIKLGKIMKMSNRYLD